MPIRATVFSIAAVLALALGNVATYADLKGAGDRPAGWDKGKKEGWQGNAPPGLEKKEGVPPGQKKKQDGGKKDGAKPEKEKKQKKDKHGKPDAAEKKDGAKPDKEKKKDKEKKEKTGG